MGKKVLLIGTYFAEGVDSFDWWQELPNISDYDIIILDTTRIFNFWSIAGRVEQLAENEYFLPTPNDQDKKIQSNIQLVGDKLLEILEFAVIVYVLYSPEIIVFQHAQSMYGGEARSRFVGTNDWCPISIDTVAEKGKIIYVKDESYKEYFRDFKGWEYYFAPASLKISDFESDYRHKWKVTPGLRVIATNKVEKPLAVEFVPLFHRWAHDEDEEEGGWYQVPEKHGGSLILLPTIDKYNTESLIELLLQIGKEFKETPPPVWVNTIEIPGEATLKSQIATEKQSLEILESRINELEGSLSGLQKYKGLLYETGLTLQELVKSTLEKLGAKIKPSIVTDEFIIEISGKEALIEVKGNTKSIAKDDVAQLVIDLMQHLKTTAEEIDGILIGNAWRLLPTEDRGTKSTPIFTGHAIRAAQNHSVRLLSTTELFKAYRKMLEEPQHKQEILNKIINSKGIIKL